MHSGVTYQRPSNEGSHRTHNQVRGDLVVGYSPTGTVAKQEKDQFWAALYTTVAQVPTKDFIVIMMDANARTRKREVNCGLKEAKVLGAYGRDILNDNGERLL